jgi:hypothetical protein
MQVQGSEKPEGLQEMGVASGEAIARDQEVPEPSLKAGFRLGSETLQPASQLSMVIEALLASPGVQLSLGPAVEDLNPSE